MNIAAIAIGSNSTRMLVHLDDGREWRERAYTHLFLDLTEDRMLTVKAMAETAQVIAGLKQLALSRGAGQVRLYATSAVRDAGNADAFARLLFVSTGLELEVISGETEAVLAFEAASGGQRCAVLDIGGGSTELTYGGDGRVCAAVSAQEGAARLRRECDIRTQDDAEALIGAVRERLRHEYHPLLSLARPPVLVGIGGTCLTSAAVQRCTPSHGDELEGEAVSAAFLRGFLERIIPLSLEERAAIPGLYASRAAIMPHGLCILLAVMQLTGFDRYQLSTHNNLDAIVARLNRGQRVEA